MPKLSPNDLDPALLLQSAIMMTLCDPIRLPRLQIKTTFAVAAAEAAAEAAATAASTVAAAAAAAAAVATAAAVVMMAVVIYMCTP